MQIDVSFLPVFAAAFMLIFARIGTMVMLLPGLGEMTVSPRVRLTIALVLTAVIMPLHRNDYQIDLRAFGPVLLTLGQELADRRRARPAGAADHRRAADRRLRRRPADGTRLRHRGRSDPGPAGRDRRQFSRRARRHADLRHRHASPGDRRAQRQLSRCSSPARCRSFGDVAAHRDHHGRPARSASACSLSAPFLVFGLLFNLGLGVLSRLMPQMQVFFVGMPLSILVGFLILLLVRRRHDDDASSTMSKACCALMRPSVVRRGHRGRRTTIQNAQKTRHKSGSTRRSSAATSSRARRSRPGS